MSYLRGSSRTEKPFYAYSIHQQKDGRYRMEFFASILLACIASVTGVCKDDLVPLEHGQLPAVWNVGTLPQIFTQAKNLRGVGALRDYKVHGLDTVTTFLYFCPADMTIYGNLTARYIQLIGHYKSFFHFINPQSQSIGNGHGFQNQIFPNLQLTNLVAPIRYSQKLKRFRVNKMQYKVHYGMHEESTSPIITGLRLSEPVDQGITAEELLTIDKAHSSPTVVEVIRAIANAKFQKGILESVVLKQMFGNLF